MNTKLVIAAVICLTGVFTYFTVLKINSSAQVAYKVITWEKYNLCFLVKPDDVIEKTQGGFKYTTGKNMGEFTIHNREITKSMKKTQFGALKGGYEKKVDFRNFEYEIADGVILRDNFDFVKKKPANILPVRDNCKHYLKRFQVLFRL
jgi:hypothetical protein